MSLVYFDTSALARWVENAVSAPRARDVHVAALVQSEIDDGAVALGVCELTLLELRAVISKDWRNTDPDHALFDAAWAHEANLMAMRLVANGRFRILATPARA